MSNECATNPPTAPPPQSPELLRLALPKGRMQEGIFALLAEAGIHVRVGSRGYRPQVSLTGIDTKILKPQNVVEMLGAGSRDVGFAGADWVRELGADVVEVLDTGLDKVRLVAAAPPSLSETVLNRFSVFLSGLTLRDFCSRLIGQRELERKSLCGHARGIA